MRGGLPARARALALGVGLVALAALAGTDGRAATEEAGEDPRPEVVLWHAYRATEAEALTRYVQELNETETRYRVKILQVPYDAFLDKITAAIPRGKGPDVFLAAHDNIGDWAEAKTVGPVDDLLDPQTLSTFFDGLVEPLLYKGHVYGLPIAFKSVVLWRNTTLAPAAPKTLSELRDVAVRTTKDGTYGFVYENRLLYFHAPLLHGFGGGLFDKEGRPALA